MIDQSVGANNVTDEKLLEEFVDGLIKEKNSPYVTDKNREEVKKMLLDDVSGAINRKLIAELDDSQVDELNILLEKKASDDEINQFFKSKIANIDETIAQALTDFKAGYLTVSYRSQQQTQTPPPASVVNKPDFPPPAPVPTDKIN